MSKIFDFNSKRNGSYIDSISRTAGINTNGVWRNTEKGKAWFANGTADINLGQTFTISRNAGTIEAWFKADVIADNDFILGYNEAAFKYLGFNGGFLRIESNSNGDSSASVTCLNANRLAISGLM